VYKVRRERYAPSQVLSIALKRTQGKKGTDPSVKGRSRERKKTRAEKEMRAGGMQAENGLHQGPGGARLTTSKGNPAQSLPLLVWDAEKTIWRGTLLEEAPSTDRKEKRPWNSTPRKGSGFRRRGGPITRCELLIAGEEGKKKPLQRRPLTEGRGRK